MRKWACGHAEKRDVFHRVPCTFLLFFLGLASCAAQEVSSGFYDALKNKNEHTLNEVIPLFENTLNSVNPFLRQAAAEELADMLYNGAELFPATLERVRREAAAAGGSWAAAFDALTGNAAGNGAAADKEKALAFLLRSSEEGARFPDQAALYTLREIRRRNAAFFSEAENAAIEGHIAVSRSRFSEALPFFRTVMESGGKEAGAPVPPLFLQYPVLINDLGRCFQYATGDDEGIDLFLAWEKTPAAGNGIRYRLLFFAGRIARRQGRLDRSMELLAKALRFAPDAAQTDACIWYILDSAMSRSAAAAVQQIETYASQWHDAAYFSDVLDKLSRDLVLRRQWKAMLNMFPLIQNYADPATAAKYAWIIARAVEEQYLSKADVSVSAAEYMRIAYNTGAASFYYRSLSADALGEPLLPALPEKNSAPDKGKTSPVMSFLLGFFEHNAAAFAPRYIRATEKNLSVDELRSLAEALAKAELYAESMRLAAIYSGRQDYSPNRRDLELQYPRPYKKPVEKYATETGLAPALLFGLIRTESAFQSAVSSWAGAVGLTQLMPATAREMAGRIRRSGGPDYTQSENEEFYLHDIETNIHIGAVYLAYLQERMGGTLLALLAYNGGMNRVRRWRTADYRRDTDNRNGELPIDLFLETIEFPETREYGRKVMAAAAVYGALY